MSKHKEKSTHRKTQWRRNRCKSEDLWAWDLWTGQQVMLDINMCWLSDPACDSLYAVYKLKAYYNLILVYELELWLVLSR